MRINAKKRTNIFYLCNAFERYTWNIPRVTCFFWYTQAEPLCECVYQVGILTNLQRLPRILIGCTFYGMVLILIYAHDLKTVDLIGRTSSPGHYASPYVPGNSGYINNRSRLQMFKQVL